MMSGMESSAGQRKLAQAIAVRGLIFRLTIVHFLYHFLLIVSSKESQTA